jgi:hypothetical protein
MRFVYSSFLSIYEFMNQYLLLRDNKQSGPYSAAELAAKGLKAYDLVWLEGKSAAWRYPSELPELKPFAPVVEEQPYDRFYKKTNEESHPALDRAQKAALTEAKKEIVEKIESTPVKKEEIKQEETPVNKEPELPNVNPKKIYVTLPSVATSANKKSFSQNINTIAEERPVVKKQETTPVIIFEDAIPNTTTDKDLYTQLQENERSRPARSRPAMRPVMLTLMAACILLFGVIIGLYISNMKQQSQNHELENMVKRIQERDQKRNEAPPVAPQNLPVQEVQTQAVDSSNVQMKEQEDPTEKLRISTVARKGNLPPDSKQQSEAELASNTVAKEDKTTYKEGAIEAARKNIHQMLLVENSKFKTGVLGGISELQMTLSNNSRFPLDQVEIEIKYFGPEQKLVKTQTLLFNDIAPGEQKTLDAPRTSRGITIDYTITRIQSKVLGLAQHKL